MKKVYPGIIHSDPDGYWIEFPDLAGCATEGDTIDELIENAEEALGAYLASGTENDIEMKEPSKIEDIEAEGNIKTYIATDVNKYRKKTKAVKKMISIPEWLAEYVDENNLSLSKIMQEALMDKIGLA